MADNEDGEVIDVVAEDVTVGPATEVYRFVGNLLSINVNHLAYVLNIIGVNVSPAAYEKMPEEIKKHFLFQLVNVSE